MTDGEVPQETSAPARPLAAVAEQADAYREGEDFPVESYTVTMAVYVLTAGILGVAARRRRGSLPERLAWADLALAGLATHKLSRLVAKDPVTSPLRAPFTRLRGTSGPKELQEEVRGRGARKAIGELLTCPFCVGQWVATGFVFGLVVAPRGTRVVASVFSTVAVADFLQFAYAAAQKKAA
jgi:hypothetical protein